jgi:hypothetical protein
MLEKLVRRPLFHDHAALQKTMRLATRRAKCISWFKQTIVMPSCASFCMTSQYFADKLRSRAEVARRRA